MSLLDNNMFKVHTFFLYDYYVSGNKDNGVADHLYYEMYKDKGNDITFNNSMLETYVAQALDIIFPNDLIIDEHSVLNWLPAVDFFVTGKNIIVEAQGPQHNILKIILSNNGDIHIERHNGSIFDRRKYEIRSIS